MNAETGERGLSPEDLAECIEIEDKLKVVRSLTREELIELSGRIERLLFKLLEEKWK